MTPHSPVGNGRRGALNPPPALMNEKPFINIQVDVDGEWISQDALGKEHSVFPDPYFKALERFEQLFDELNIRATFFVVGKDLEVKEKRSSIERLARKGHEIANHSMNHLFGFSTLSNQEKEKEIAEAEVLIQETCGKRPVGFRVPSYDVDENTLKILEKRGYLYDSSLVPSPWLALIKVAAKIFYLGSYKAPNRLGGLLQTFSPIYPFKPQKDRYYRRDPLATRQSIIELPIAVVPFLRIPFYSTLHMVFGRHFFDMCYIPIRMRNLSFSYVFHLVDLTDPVNDGLSQEGQILPAPIKLSVKMRRMRHILEKLCHNKNILTAEDFARKFSAV